jgi:excisionase family DNA binding protein
MRDDTRKDRAELSELLRDLAEAKKAVVDRESQLLGVMFELLLCGKENRVTAPAAQEAELMNIKQAADYLNVTPRTIGNWLERGWIRGLKFGDEWRILRAELIADGRKFREAKSPMCATFAPLQSGCNPSNQEQNK